MGVVCCLGVQPTSKMLVSTRKLTVAMRFGSDVVMMTPAYQKLRKREVGNLCPTSQLKFNCHHAVVFCNSLGAIE